MRRIMTCFLNFVMLLVPCAVFAGFEIAWTQTGMPYSCTTFIGAANMDDDPWLELVYVRDDALSSSWVLRCRNLVVLDGATGNIEWNSEDAGLGSLDITTGYQHFTGKGPFCDVNNDGIKELTFAGYTGTAGIYLLGFSSEKGKIAVTRLGQQKAQHSQGEPQ